jgi:trypsin
MRKLLIAATALGIVLVTAPPGNAVNGPPDGNDHPNVGVMLVLDGNGEIFEFCDGVLVAPTVFLTNYNCPGAVDFARSIGGRAVISFDQVFWPLEDANLRTVAAGYVHPDADPRKATNLYGIAVLARPVRGITPAELPTLHQLDSLRKGQTLTVVGSGSADATRRVATPVIAGISDDIITLQNNSSATGEGGVCGDGGAPFFLGSSNVVVAVADGAVGRCNAISWAFRNDTATARSFFDDFVAVP